MRSIDGAIFRSAVSNRSQVNTSQLRVHKISCAWGDAVDDFKDSETIERVKMLKEKLQVLIDQSAGKIPNEAMSVIKQSMQEVADSIASRNIPKLGDIVPEFDLADSNGNSHSSSSLIADGQLIVSFFRGGW